MKKIAIKGSKNPEEQKEVIEILKSLGGENIHNFVGDMHWAYYYINGYNIIDTACDIDNLEGYVLLTLKQYKQKYKYMENKNLQIIPPEGYEIDKENSTLEKIVFKKVEEKLTYEKIADKLFQYESHYYIDENGHIMLTSAGWQCLNVTPTPQQLNRVLALNKLMNVAYYLNNDWKPNWNNNIERKYFIYYDSKDKTFIIDYTTYFNCGIVYFESEELAKQAIEILGEETIKLALGVL